MDKSKQQMRYSDSEMSLVKNTFEDRDELLKAVRKIMLGCEITETELTMVRDAYTKPVKELFQKAFLPTLVGNEPLGQTIDLWMTIDVKDKTPDMADVFIRAREKTIGLLEKGLQALEDGVPFTKATAFKLNADPHKQMVDLLARNTYISHIEQRLIELKSLASMVTESDEERRTRLAKDSSQ